MATPQEIWELYRDWYGVSTVHGLQSIAGLPPTGHLDEATLAVLQQPRCGVLDSTRMTLEGRWRNNRLNYFVESYVGGLDQSTVDDILRAAWKSWEDVADVKFLQVGGREQANLIISTGRGQRPGFDGAGGTLAWAELPQGDDRPLTMRFDLDERWVVQGQGIRLLNVAAHEFGHLLGLDHSRQSGALMAPFYASSVAKPQPVDDVPRIQSLYGLPLPAVPTPSPVPPLPGVPPMGTFFEWFKKILDLLHALFGSASPAPVPGGQPAPGPKPFLDWLAKLFGFFLGKFGANLSEATEPQLYQALTEYQQLRSVMV